jgi:hypothetical protein
VDDDGPGQVARRRPKGVRQRGVGRSAVGAADPNSAVPREGEAGEANRQQGPRGKLWNCGRGRASGDHDFCVAIGGEKSAGMLENTVFLKGGVETTILG